MPYALKNAQGQMVAVSEETMQGPDWLEIDATDPQYIAFLEKNLSAGHPFRESDIQLARVLEDLISLLIDRDLIRFTDFPEPAQKRLIDRQSLRMRGSRLSLIDDDDQLKL